MEVFERRTVQGTYNTCDMTDSHFETEWRLDIQN